MGSGSICITIIGVSSLPRHDTQEPTLLFKTDCQFPPPTTTLEFMRNNSEILPTSIPPKDELRALFARKNERNKKPRLATSQLKKTAHIQFQGLVLLCLKSTDIPCISCSLHLCPIVPSYASWPARRNRIHQWGVNRDRNSTTPQCTTKFRTLA